MKKIIFVAFITASSFGFSGCALFGGNLIDKAAADQNLRNVEKIVEENNEFTKSSSEPDLVKESRYERNEKALKLAKEISKAASK